MDRHAKIILEIFSDNCEYAYMHSFKYLCCLVTGIIAAQDQKALSAHFEAMTNVSEIQ